MNGPWCAENLLLPVRVAFALVGNLSPSKVTRLPTLVAELWRLPSPGTLESHYFIEPLLVNFPGGGWAPPFDLELYSRRWATSSTP